MRSAGRHVASEEGGRISRRLRENEEETEKKRKRNARAVNFDVLVAHVSVTCRSRKRGYERFERTVFEDRW